MRNIITIIILILTFSRAYAAILSDDFSTFSSTDVLTTGTDSWNGSGIYGGYPGWYNGVCYSFLATNVLSSTWAIVTSSTTDLIHFNPIYGGSPVINAATCPECLVDSGSSIVSMTPLVDKDNNLVQENGYFWALFSRKVDGVFQNAIYRATTPTGPWNPYYATDPCDTSHGSFGAQGSGWAVSGAFITGFFKDEDGTYYASGTDPGFQNGGLFYTSDFRGSWTCHSTVLLATGGGDEWIHDVSIRKFDGTYYLFYTGRETDRYGTCYATSSTALGTYTKYASNPISPMIGGSGYTAPYMLSADGGYYQYSDVGGRKLLIAIDSLTPTTKQVIWVTTIWGIIGGTSLNNPASFPRASDGILTISNGGGIFTRGNTSTGPITMTFRANFVDSGTGSKFVGVVDNPVHLGKIQNRVTVGTKNGSGNLFLFVESEGATTETDLGEVANTYNVYELEISASSVSLSIDGGTPTLVETNVPQVAMNIKAHNNGDSSYSLLVDYVNFSHQYPLTIGAGYSGTASWQ